MQQDNLTTLAQFVEASKTKGASDDFLASLLVHRGWPEDEVYASLGTYWERVTGIPVPERSGRAESSRDAFLYLLSFSTLATWASALGSMLFRFIDTWYPDPVASQFYNLRAAVTWQMASIAVAFPIFLLVMRFIGREERTQSGVRKWLTYIALLLTAGGVICDLIYFLDAFLTGELTVRFVLKSLTALLICGSIFFYYLGWLRRGKNSGVFGAAATAVVVVTFCVGLGVAGTPSQQRKLEADNTRVQDLKRIESAVHFWYMRPQADPLHTRMPGSVSDLLGQGVERSHTVDPETKMPYEYRILSGSGYQICASFSAPGANAGDRIPTTELWSHGKGRVCFSRDASSQPGW